MEWEFDGQNVSVPDDWDTITDILDCVGQGDGQADKMQNLDPECFRYLNTGNRCWVRANGISNIKFKFFTVREIDPNAQITAPTGPPIVIPTSPVINIIDNEDEETELLPIPMFPKHLFINAGLAGSNANLDDAIFGFASCVSATFRLDWSNRTAAQLLNFKNNRICIDNIPNGSVAQMGLSYMGA
jgi:hypothetical protein